MSEIRQASRVFSVTQLTDRLKAHIEMGFAYVWVNGEITNFSRAPSGHIYFSLKDATAQLSCVWFTSKQKAGRNFDPLTGEVFEKPRPDPANQMRDGLQLCCAGQISIYKPRGQYQLIIDQIMFTGVGSLAQAFEERKRKYAELGYFSPERKRPLPMAFGRIALVTSRHGAAIHDFLRLVEERGLGGKIRLFPVPVQGGGAAEKIANAINAANEQNWAEVIVLIRGGGSIEDLWAFNEDIVARAVFDSALPVIAGIGHEVDFTLADMTADLRAATPSHAAQILWPLRQEIAQTLDEMERGLNSLAKGLLGRQEQRLARESKTLNLLSPAARVRRNSQEIAQAGNFLQKQYVEFLKRKWQLLDGLGQRLRNGAERMLERQAARVGKGLLSLGLLSPEAKLKRMAGDWARLNAALHKQAMLFYGRKLDLLQSKANDLEKNWRPAERLVKAENSLGLLEGSLTGLYLSQISRQTGRLRDVAAAMRERGLALHQAKLAEYTHLEYGLKSLDPLAPLKRGYAVIYHGNRIVRAVKDCLPGESLRVLLQDGELDVKIEQTRGNNANK